jgi:tripartite-type tricarboxylate transporter receptor subunit TctC
VPAAAGGPLDVLARILSERMRLSLAQPLLIENVAGAAGSIGGVARAPPDGYTLSMGMWGTHVVNPAIYALACLPCQNLQAEGAPAQGAFRSN